MKEVRVELGPRSYDILIAPDLLEQAGPLFKKQALKRRLFLVSNTKVFSLYGIKVKKSLEESGFSATEIFIPDGEAYKNLHTVENIFTYLAAQRADRDSTIAAIGGGVTGDIAGFVAATFLRGLDCVQIPTTLLSQVDSSVGGKTGVNHQKGKNLIGAFHQPRLVLIDTGTLASLPDRDFRSGLYEVLKYGLIYDADFFSLVESKLDSLLAKDQAVLEQVIARCCEIKADITSRDERESGLRRILNFGHTFGHALEVSSAYVALTHGEAVAWGMLAAVEISKRVGLIDKATADRISTTILEVGPLPSVHEIELEDIWEAMEHDKKRQDDVIHFVLLSRIGQTQDRSDLDSEFLDDVWQSVSREQRG